MIMCSAHAGGDPKHTFAPRFKNWRKQTRYPLKHVADDLGVSIATVSEWENGGRFPNADHLRRISEYTGIPLCGFFCPAGHVCPYLKAKPA